LWVQQTKKQGRWQKFYPISRGKSSTQKKNTFQVFKHSTFNKDLKNTNVVEKKIYKASLKKEKTNLQTILKINDGFKAP
jgi:hypothetical protein